MFSTIVVRIIERIMLCHLHSVLIVKMMFINLHIHFHILIRNCKIISINIEQRQLDYVQRRPLVYSVVNRILFNSRM